MTSYQKENPPYIIGSASVSNMTWKKVAFLIPLVIVRIALPGSGAGEYLLVAVFSVLGACWMTKAIFDRYSAFSSGFAVLTAALMAVILPPGIPLWMVAAGSFFAIFFAVEIFGGLGANPFHPAAAAVALLTLSLPAVFLQPAEGHSPLIGFAGAWSDFPEKIWGEWHAGHAFFISGAATLLGGALLIWQKVIRWEVPLLYLMTVYLGTRLGAGSIFDFPVFIYAFFIVTDSVTSCATRSGQMVFTLGAGLLLCLAGTGRVAGAAALSVLVMNGIAPWIDLLFQPRGERILAAYSSKISKTG
jgi:electron transport complex protein RnfD